MGQSLLSRPICVYYQPFVSVFVFVFVFDFSFFAVFTTTFALALRIVALIMPIDYDLWIEHIYYIDR